MLRYEILILANPEITNNEYDSLKKFFEETMTKNKGFIISFDRWGKYKLAYEVKKREYGIYYLIRFEAERLDSAKIIKEIDQNFKIKYFDLILKYFIQKLSIKSKLEYKRPDSLEDVPKNNKSNLNRKDDSIAIESFVDEISY